MMQDALHTLSQQLSPSGLALADRAGVALRFVADSMELQANVAGFRDSFYMVMFVFIAVLLPTWFTSRSIKPVKIAAHAH